MNHRRRIPAQITQITYPSKAETQFTYDGGGNRVKIVEISATGTVTSTKQFIIAGAGIAEEYDTTSTTQPTKRFYGSGYISYSGSTGTSYFYTRDHLGSIRELTSSTGSVVTRLDYDPWGVTSVVSGTVIPDFA